MPAFHLVNHLFDASEVVHELCHAADGFRLVNGNVGFVDVRLRPFHVRPRRAPETVRMSQSGADAFLGDPQLGQQRLPLGFYLLEIAVAHDYARGSADGVVVALSTG
jgi:hypothetical protein